MILLRPRPIYLTKKHSFSCKKVTNVISIFGFCRIKFADHMLVLQAPDLVDQVNSDLVDECKQAMTEAQTSKELFNKCLE